MLPAPMIAHTEENTTPTVPLHAVKLPVATADQKQFFQTPTGKSAQSPPNIMIRATKPVDPEQVARYLEQYVNAISWEDAHILVRDHPELLSHTAIMLLRMNINRVANTVGPAAAQMLARYLEVLQIAQREGVDAAFDAIDDVMFAADLETLLVKLESPDHTSNVSERIALCEEAIQLAARDQHDGLWASLHLEMGMLLLKAQYGIDRSSFIERSIDAFSMALDVFGIDEYPAEWSMTNHYLGIALLEREGKDRAADIDQAVDLFQEALKVRTRDTYPADWAATQEALGSTFYQRINGDRGDNLDRCIACYEASLTIRTREKYPLEWASDQMSLGNAYGLRRIGDRQDNLEHAIAAFEKALTAFTIEKHQSQWLLLHHNLGVAYMDRMAGARSDNIEKAIEHYSMELSVQSRERSPIDWADTLNNLGNAYRARKNGSREENLNRAIELYQQSLKVRTPEVFPVEHRRTARNLGSLLFDNERWIEAHEMLASAIQASDMLYILELGQSTGNAGQRLRDHNELVALDAYCLAKLNRPREAIMRLEQGRGRALQELLERDRTMLMLAHGPVRAQFGRAQQNLASVVAQMQRMAVSGALFHDSGEHEYVGTMTPAMRQAMDDLSWQRQQARAALDASITALRKTSADFLYPQISYKYIAQTSTKECPVIYLVSTIKGSLAMIVDAKAQADSAEQLIWMPLLTSEQLREALPQAHSSEMMDHTPLGLIPRSHALDQVLQLVGKAIMTPLAQHLIMIQASSVVLIPIGFLAALPLHAAPLTGTFSGRDAEGVNSGNMTNPLFLDVFEVSYAPSAQRLAMAQTGSKFILKSGTAAVGNPQPDTIDLTWAEHEAGAIAQVANRAGQSTTLLIRRQATADAVIKAFQERAYVHLACPGGVYADKPAESFIALSGSESVRLKDFLNGTISLRGLRLLVLSAGQSTVISGLASDENLSMTTAFLMSGAAGVIGSLWPSSDLATLLLMRTFAQQYLNDNRQPAQALRNAQQWLRTVTLATLQRDFSTDITRDPDINMADFSQPQDCPFAHPVFWAGFMIHGQ